MEASKKLRDAARPTPDYGAATTAHRGADERATGDADRGSSQFRIQLYVMLFLGASISYTVRVSLSQALVAMVNHTSLSVNATDWGNASADLCPRDQLVNTTTDDVTGSGEFDWNRHEQGAVLGAFYYGYALTQVPGGWLADRFGGTWLLGAAMAIESVLVLLMPAAAHLHVGAVIGLRVLTGIADGVCCPTTLSLVAGLAPGTERSRAVAFAMSGTSFGTIVGMLVSGVLCDHAGWPAVFYTFGLAGCGWTAAWCVVGSVGCCDRPLSSRRVTSPATGTRRRTPWRRILSSGPVWAGCVGYTAAMWGFVTLLTCLPTYLSDVLGYGMTANGYLSTLPYLADGVMLLLAGFLADQLLRTAAGRLWTGFVRKSFCAVGLAASSVFIFLPGLLGCRRALIIACLALSTGMVGLAMPTVAANFLDLSPSDAGTLMGLSNAVANAVSVLAPHVVSALTYNGSTRAQWTNVFAIVAAINAAGAAVFVIFGSGRRQDWAAE